MLPEVHWSIVGESGMSKAERDFMADLDRAFPKAIVPTWAWFDGAEWPDA